MGGGYPYMFCLYSGFLKDIIIENNTITGPGNKLGLFTYNATIRNNTLSTSFRTFGIAGNIIIENNKNFDPNNFNSIYSLESEIGNSIHPDYLSYEQVKEIGVNFKFNNNETGLSANFTNFEDLTKNDYMKIEISGNKLRKAVVTAYGIKDFEFDPEQFNYETSSQAQMVRGAHYVNPSTPRAWGHGYFEEGEVMFESMEKLGVIGGKYFNDESFNGIENFEQYNRRNWACFADRNGIKSIKMVCTKAGYMPDGCNHYFNDCDTAAEIGVQVAKGAYIYSDTSLYYVLNEEKATINEIPTHKNGIKEYDGGLKVAYIGELAQYELIYEK